MFKLTVALHSHYTLLSLHFLATRPKSELQFPQNTALATHIVSACPKIPQSWQRNVDKKSTHCVRDTIHVPQPPRLRRLSACDLDEQYWVNGLARLLSSQGGLGWGTRGGADVQLPRFVGLGTHCWHVS